MLLYGEIEKTWVDKWRQFFFKKEFISSIFKKITFIKWRQEDNCWSWELRSFNYRFPSVSAIFDGAIRLETTSRWNVRRLPSLLPFTKKMMYEEVISANDNLRSIYSQDAQSFKKLLEQILNYGVFKSRQYKYFLCRVFLGETLVHLLAFCQRQFSLWSLCTSCDKS